MAYQGDSEDFEEEEEDEEEEGVKVHPESTEERDVTAGDENAQGRSGGEESESRGSKHSFEAIDDGQLSDSDHEDDGTGKNNDGDQGTPNCSSNNSDEVRAGGLDRLSPPRMVSSGEFDSDLDYNEEEDDQRKSRPAERGERKGSDEGELSSDEEGEIKEKFYRDYRPRHRTRKSRSVSPVPPRFDTSICRHYLAGTCDWGRSCRFRHPPADELIELKGKGMLPPDHRSRRHDGRDSWSNLRGTPPHRHTHPHDGPSFGAGPGFGHFSGRYPNDYPGGDFGHQLYPHGPYPPVPYMDHGRPPFGSAWMGYGQDSQGGMQEESDGWIRLKMPVLSSSWDMDDTSPPRNKKRRRRDRSSESENSDEEGKLKAKKKKKKSKKHKESDSEESSLGQKAERKKKKKQKLKEIEHSSNSDGEGTVSKGRKKKAKQRKQQREDSQERGTDSEREKKSTKEEAGSLSGGSKWKKSREKDWAERSMKEEDSEMEKSHKYREIEKELQIVTAAINRRTKNKR